MGLSDVDIGHLSRCLELAREALDNGDAPFGSVLVDTDGRVLHEDRNRTGDGDNTRHPEFEIARWAAAHLPQAHRSRTTVYTSCEHCPMCAAAHAWVGLGRIVYATSGRQLRDWVAEAKFQPLAVAPLPITTVAPDAITDGPAPQFEEELHALYLAYFQNH